MKMKTIHFYVLVPVIAAAECGLILAGLLPPLSSYSAGQIVFGLIMISVMICMGLNLAELGFRKVTIKGAVASLGAVIVVSLFSAVGYIIKKPVLGVSLPSVYFLPVVLFFMGVENILIFTFFAVFGRWLAHKIRPVKKSEKAKKT